MASIPNDYETSETRDGILPESDYEYAEELQFQELLEASLFRHGESSRISCEICAEGKERNEMFKIKTCSHSFCIVCIAKYVQTKIEEHIHVITCPNCNSLIEPVSCHHIIPEDTFARWMETSIEVNILYETPGQDGRLHVSDSEYAEELQVQELLVNYLSELDLQISQQGELSRTNCEICIEEKEPNEMFKIEGCSYSFCVDCIAKHVQTKIKEHIHAIACPNCNTIIEPDSCRQIIPEDDFARWVEASVEATVLPSQRFYCPYNDCSFMLINDEDQETIRESECPSCRRLFCAQCKVPWLMNHECEEFQKSKEDGIENDETRLKRLVRENNWMKCPNCNSIVDRIEGCIHMTCRCGCEFCYVCGSNWSQSHWECQDEEA